MIADKLYDELKRLKGSDKSFSEVITGALEESKPKKKTMAGLLKFAGVFEGDKEYDEAMKLSKKVWKKWDKRIEKILSS